MESFYAEEADGYGDCPALAALVDELGWETMLVPSAAWQRPDGLCAPVFAAGRERLVEATQVAEIRQPHRRPRGGDDVPGRRTTGLAGE